LKCADYKKCLFIYITAIAWLADHELQL